MPESRRQLSNREFLREVWSDFEAWAARRNLDSAVGRWIDFRSYVGRRRHVFANPAAALADYENEGWIPRLQYLAQGLVVPALVLLVLGWLCAYALPAAPPDLDKAAVLKAQIHQLDASTTDLADYSHQLLGGALQRELALRAMVRHVEVAYLTMAPLAVLLLSLLSPFVWLDSQMRRVSKARARTATAYIAGMHLFWTNAVNALFLVLLNFFLRSSAKYGAALGMELTYLLFLLLAAGAASYFISRDLRKALALNAPDLVQGYVWGDKIKWVAYAMQFASLALVVVVLTVIRQYTA